MHSEFRGVLYDAAFIISGIGILANEMTSMYNVKSISPFAKKTDLQVDSRGDENACHQRAWARLKRGGRFLPGSEFPRKTEKKNEEE